ncbi:unnamed protein product [Cercospora beticola]|nr:unnamed protein product [Cercospora beticola]
MVLTEPSCRSSPKLDIEDSLHEPLRLKMETLRAANTHEGDPTADILLFPFCNQLCSAYCTASNELRDSASNCWSVVWRLTQHNVLKDGDHIKEHVNVDIERYEASLSAFRRDLAKCAADTFNSVRRTIGALRDTFEQLRLEGKKNCDGSDVQRFYSPMSRCEQYYFLIAMAERLQKPPFSDGTHARRNRELRHNLEAAMFLLSFEEQREWIRKAYELVDVKVREDLQKAFPSDFAETLQD